MRVQTKERFAGAMTYLQVPGYSGHQSGQGLTRSDDDAQSHPPTRAPSNLASLLITPEIRIGTRSLTPRLAAAVPWTPRPQLASGMSNRTRQKRQDEESLRTRIFWEQYAKEVQKDVLKETLTENPKLHLIYSGHCGPELKFRRSESCESLVTNLSLLSTSSLGQSKPLRPFKKKKNRRDDPQPVKPDWVKLAKERRGALDRLIAKDTANLEGLAKVSGSNIIIQRAKVSELMSEEEKDLLLRCGYRQGIAGRDKSFSTANVLSILSKSDRRNLKIIRCQSRKVKTSTGAPSEGSSRTLSPNDIRKQVRHQKRPESAAAAAMFFDDTHSGGSQKMSIIEESMHEHRANNSQATMSVHGLSDFQEPSAMTERVRNEMKSTLNQLNSMTGVGDPTDSQTSSSDDKRFTRADYALIPRYPHTIKIAPHLSKVIVQDIRKRMGRPRHKQLSATDLELFNSSLPQLGRSSRNLMIFNWLISLDEDYLDASVPGIYDIEGETLVNRYPTIHDEIVGVSEGSEYDDTDTNGPSSVAATSTIYN